MIIQSIGIIRSPFTDLAGMPIQPKGAEFQKGSVELDEEYAEGLKDLDGFSHVYLLYHFHKASRIEMTVIPYMDTRKRGVFSTRSPLRPNHIGISIVRLKKIEGRVLTVEGIDVLDGTPLLDIKPYIAGFDAVENSLSGWMQASADDIMKKRSDSRFE